MIYLDNAATTVKKPPAVIESVTAALTCMGSANRAAHDISLSASRIVYEARGKLAAMFSCDAERVVFTANATEALNIAVHGVLKPGDHALTTDWEHNSVLRPLYRLERDSQVGLSFAPADSAGSIDYADFERFLQPDTRAIICTHASNLTGDMFDLGRIGELAKTRDILFIVDASQTAGIFPLDMKRFGIDILCFTGHKSLLGPQGVGGLAIGSGVDIAPWKVGGTGMDTFNHDQPQAYPERLEAGTLNAHGIAGLSAALDFIHDTGMQAIRMKEQALADRFYQGIKDLPQVTCYGDFSRERAPIVSLNIGTTDSGTISAELADAFGIATRPGGHCAPRLHEALGTKRQGAVRFSFSWFNTADETDAAIEAIRYLATE